MYFGLTVYNLVEESKTYGSIECDTLLRKRFARQSGMENLKDEKFKELFPGWKRLKLIGYVILLSILDLVQEIKETIIEHKTKLESSLAKKEEKRVCLSLFYKIYKFLF